MKLKLPITICLILTFAWVQIAGAADTCGSISGTIRNARAVVYGDKSSVLIKLQGQSETFVIRTADAPKFGLLKPKTAASLDKDLMQPELDAAKGWKVKLTLTSEVDASSLQFRVQNLERVSEQ